MPADTNADKEEHPYHRRFVRHKVRLKIEVQTNESFHSWTNNLSEDGVCFEIPRRVPIGSQVIVWIYTSRGKSVQPIQSHCRVVWQDRGKKGFRHGGQFLRLVADGRERLQRFLAELTRPITQPPPP